MSTYKISYEQIRQNPLISSLLTDLEEGFAKFGLDYFLVGATARDVWISGIHFKIPGRATKDLDFAVLINDKGIYEQLKEYLAKEKGFQPSAENAFLLIYKERIQVDLIPFGAIEDEDRKVTVEGTGYTTVHVPGFAEIYSAGLPEMDLEGKHQFKFCTLPGIVILKLLAWDDRPETRQSDILDISDILHHYFSMQDNEIWENHFDLFTGDNTDLLHVAARVMGREMRKIVIKNEALFQRMDGILERNSADVDHCVIGAIMTGYFNNTVQENMMMIAEIRKGLLDQ